MRSTGQLLEPFARAIHAKWTALNDGEAPKLTPNQRARLLESISDDIKKCSNFVVPEVSVAARQEATNTGVDLYSMTWHDQPSFDAGREIFHLEHVQPVSSIREKCRTCNSPEATGQVLAQELRVAWILKAEDAELTRLGYRSKRPDPEKAYADAGIRLLVRGSA